MKNHRKIREAPQMEDFRQGWAAFPPDVAWFIYDFFTHALSPNEQLLFYGYYIMGFTLEELGERFHCTFQNIAIRIEKLNRKLKMKWKYKEYWRLPDERERRDGNYCSPHKRRSQ